MREPALTHPSATVYLGDCLDVLTEIPDNSIDAIVTDPPYGLGFMGKAWDDLPPGLPWAEECLRVLKPGGHLLAFGGTRTWHRLAVAVEDAGFEVRDSIAWLYGSGFPKSLDVSKAIDKAARGVPQGGTDPTSPNHGKYRTTTTEGKRWDGDAGQGYGAGGSRFLAPDRSGSPTSIASERMDVPATATTPLTGTEDAAAADGSPTPTPGATVPTDDAAQQWSGWGTALKPAFEPIVVARKPLTGTVAANVLAHGTGALNIDGCRVQGEDAPEGRLRHGGGSAVSSSMAGPLNPDVRPASPAGRWPANVLLDGSQADALDAEGPHTKDGVAVNRNKVDGRKVDNGTFYMPAKSGADVTFGGEGGPSRFFPVFRTLTDVEKTVIDRATSDDATYEEAAMSLVEEGVLSEEDILADAEPSQAAPALPTFRYQAKAPTRERPTVTAEDGTKTAHPTVKPLALMRWLVRLVTPPGGTVLDTFTGSGATVEAAILEGFYALGIEREADYLPLIQVRLDRVEAPSADTDA